MQRQNFAPHGHISHGLPFMDPSMGTHARRGLDIFRESRITSKLLLAIFLWLPYANIFTTGPPVFVNSPFRLGKITNCSVETVSRHFSFL